MKRTYSLLSLSCLALFGSCSPNKAEKTPPNVIFILADDLGWMDLGCYGSSFYETPNLDQLAREGVRFTNAYAACPVSSPTRVSIQTGRYPGRVHVTDWIPGKYDYNKEMMQKVCPVLPPDYNYNMSLEEVTIAEAMKEGGYKTIHVGKWHCCEDPGYYPQYQGYDVNIGGCEMGSPRGKSYYFSPYNNPMLPDGPKGEYLTDRLGDECVKQIRENKDKPFFINMDFYQVHTPLMAKEEQIRYFQAKYDRMRLDTLNTFIEHPDYVDRQPFPADLFKERIVQSNVVYAAMIASMDENIGKIIKELKDQGLYENTIIMFMSDNGGLSTSEGSATSNLPLRGGKGHMYEGGIREPFIVYGPGVKEKDWVTDAVITSTDFYPTILEMTGLPAKPKQHLDGKSFASVLKGEGNFDRGPIFWHYPHYPNQGGRPSGAIRSGNYKLIEFYDNGEVELYDLSKDIGEQHDLAKEQPELANILKHEFDQGCKDIEASMPTKNPAFN